MPTEISGSTGVNKIQDGTVVNADINSSAAIAGTKLVMPTGSILQIVQASSNTATYPTQSWTDLTGSSISITPSATSSKIIYIFSAGGMCGSNTGGLKLKLLRDSTEIRRTNRYGYSTLTYVPLPMFWIYLDSPSSTSAITYKLQGSEENSSGGWEVNPNAETAGALAIAMEVAG